MLTYNALKDKAREFLAATGLKIEEFARLLPAFESAYHALYPLNQTAEGKTRQRLPGGGTKGTRRTVEDKLLFILVYQKTYPLQTMPGLQFGLSRPQTHYWIHRLLPVLQRALADLNMTPEREGEHVAPVSWSTSTRPIGSSTAVSEGGNAPRTRSNSALTTAARRKRLRTRTLFWLMSTPAKWPI